MGDRFDDDLVVHETMEIAAPAPEVWAALVVAERRTG